MYKIKNDMAKTISSTTLRDNLANSIKTVSEKEKYFIVTKKGKPVSVLADINFFEDLLALSSPKYLESIRDARKDYQQNNIFSHSEVFGELK